MAAIRPVIIGQNILDLFIRVSKFACSFLLNKIMLLWNSSINKVHVILCFALPATNRTTEHLSKPFFDNISCSFACLPLNNKSEIKDLVSYGQTENFFLRNKRRKWVHLEHFPFKLPAQIANQYTGFALSWPLDLTLTPDNLDYTSRLYITGGKSPIDRSLVKGCKNNWFMGLT